MPPTLPPQVQKVLTMDDLRIARLMGYLTEPRDLADADIILSHEFTQVLDQPWQIANFIPVLAVGAVQVKICEFAVPAQQLGICRSFGLALTNFIDFGNVQWQLQVNGGAVSGFDNIRGQMGNILFPQPLSVPLFRTSRIRVVASNIGVAPVLFPTARIGGDTFNAVTLAGAMPPATG
jgi:hypothetical protein